MCARHVLSEPRIVCAALRYVDQYLLSRIELLPGLCPLDVCCESLGLWAFEVYRTCCAALRYVGHYV